MQKSARMSADGRYRWCLTREWEPFGALLGFIMLNPSTADAEDDDPTIRRCVGFARREGYGGIRVANLFGLRATDPAELDVADDPVGHKPCYGRRCRCIRYDPWGELIFCCQEVVVAWGAAGGKHTERVAEVVEEADGWPMWCLGTTKEGHPRHPLYVRADQPLQRWTT